MYFFNKGTQIFLIFSVMATFLVTAQTELPEKPLIKVYSEASNNDGIITGDEVVDSPILQSHGNPPEDLSEIMLSTYLQKHYITAQVESFKYLGSEYESFLPWPLPRKKHDQVYSFVTKVVRYNLVRKKVPHYRYRYKYVTKYIYVREGGSSGSRNDSDYGDKRRSRSGKLVRKRVRTKVLVSVKQTGFRTQRVKVLHPEGKYKEEIQIRNYKSIGMAALPNGWYSVNARALFTMVQAGVSGDDPQFKLTIQSINNLLYAYGIPDHTTDIAWLSSLYVNLPQDDPAIKYWTERLVSRLISGAAQMGEFKGLWGPLCINPRYINAIARSDEKMYKKYILPLEREIVMETRDRPKKRLQEKFFEINKAYEEWQQIYLTWAMSGSAVNRARFKNIIPAVSKGQKNNTFDYSLEVPGLTQDAYHFQFTDLESTTIALFALHEAKVNNLLPAFTLAPVDVKKRKLGKPIDTAQQLEQCYATLRSLRLKTGGWNACYSGVFHRLCRHIPYLSTLPKTAFSKIKSEPHWSYDIMGLASMDYLAVILGGNPQKAIATTYAPYRVKLIQSLLKKSDALDFDAVPSQNNFLYFLADVISIDSSESQFLRQNIGKRILSRIANDANLTSIECYNTYSATHSLDYEYKYFEPKKDLPKVYYVEGVIFPIEKELMHLHDIRSLSAKASFTYFLNKGIREPLFVSVRPLENPPEFKALDHFIRIRKNQKLNLNCFHVASASDISQYSTALHLVMEATDDMDSDLEMQLKLADYIKLHEGIVIVLTGPDTDTPATEKTISHLLKLTKLPFKKMNSSIRGCPCIEYTLDDQLAILIVDTPQEKSLSNVYKTRLKVYESLLKENLPLGYLKPDYGLLKEHLSHHELKLTGVEWVNKTNE